MRVSAPAPVTPRCLATRSATRSRRRSSAGTGDAASRDSCAALYERQRRRIPSGLVTYVNYPSTEYLQLALSRFPLLQRLPGVRQSGSRRYLARLQNLAGDGRWCMAEIGLDSRSQRRGAAGGGRSSGRCGRLRGGLRRRVRLRLDRRVAPRRATTSRTGTSASPTATAEPKPALAAVRRAFREVPVPPPTAARPECRSSSAPTTARERSRCAWRRSGARLPGLRGDRRRRRLDRRAPLEIAERFGYAASSARRTGASACARNTGLEAATGEIVAYTDDDASPDPRLARPTSSPRCRRASTPASAGRTSRRRRTASCRLRRRRPRAGRATCCSPTRSPSTSPAATWRSAASALLASSAASTRSSARPATTSTSAGACRSRLTRSASARPRSSGIAAAQLGARLLAAAARLREGRGACSSASGRRSTTRGGHVPGRGRLYGNGAAAGG